MKKYDYLDTIETLEIKLRHLRNQNEVILRQYEKTSDENFKILADISKANEQLKREIADRKKAEDELRKSHDDLEVRIQERTEELAHANKKLQRDIAKRKKTEEALRKSKKTSDDIIQSIPSGMFIYQFEKPDKLILIDGNTEAERLMNIKIDEYSGKEFNEIWPKAKAFGFYEACLKVIKTGEMYETEDLQYEDSRLAGAFRVHAFMVPGNKICVAFENVTQRKKAEIALQESEAKHRVLIENSPDIIMRFDRDYRHQFVSPSIESVVDISPEIFIGKTHRELGFPDDQCIFWQQKIQEVFDAGDPVEELFKFNSVVGTICFDWKLIPEFGENGDVNTVMSVARDITNIKKAEEALKKEKEYLNMLHNSIGDVIFSTTYPARKIEFVNHAVHPIFGYTPQDIIGNTSEILYPVRNAYLDFGIKLKNAIDSGEDILHAEHNLIRKNGEVFPAEITYTFLKENDSVINVISIVKDITHRKRLEEQLQIQERMDSLGTLAGGIAHDFNNLLVGIMGNIDMLRMESDSCPRDQQEFIENAFQSSRRAAKLIREIQSLSRGAISETTNVDLFNVAQDVFSILDRTTDKLIEKIIDIDPGKYCVTGRPDQLHQVLLNLGTNAVQAIREKGTKYGDYIAISAKEHEIVQNDRTGLHGGKYIHIFFKDTGIGMSEGVKRRAFDPLFTTKDLSTQKGQGLGLAMVYNIITRYHDGFIDIETTFGKGTTFHIYLPKAENEKSAEPQPTAKAKNGNETILVVDDEETVRTMIHIGLSKYGYSILSATEGQDGLNMYTANRNSIDLVILDLTMPKMSGKIFLDKILEINPDVKVIISSGHSEEEMKKHTLAKGYISKPFSVKELAQTIRIVLDL